jgi:hypothetical protein
MVSFITVIIGDEASLMPITMPVSARYDTTATSFMDGTTTTATNAILLVNQSIINNFKTRLLFVNTNITCPNTIDVDLRSSPFNNTNIKGVEELLKICEPSNFQLLYDLGSMIVSIQGKENGLCSIKIVHEIKIGESRFSCLVPLDKVAIWSSWKKGNGLVDIEMISHHFAIV